jgi:hypothetical protein
MSLVSFLARHGLHARNKSPLERNAIFCARQYGLVLSDLVSGTVSAGSVFEFVRIISTQYNITVSILARAWFLLECIFVHDGVFALSAGFSRDTPDTTFWLC